MSMQSIFKDKLIFDPASISDSDNVGSFVTAADGTLITQTTYGAVKALDVSISNASIAVTSGANYAEDSAHVSGDLGTFALAVRHDAETSMVSADGDYAPLQVNSVGRLKVDAEVSVVSGSDKAEDSSHVSGDIGAYVLAVRQDVLTSSVSADGDYASFKLDANGALWVSPIGNVADDAVDAGNPIKVGSRAVSGPLGAVSSGDRADLISDIYRRVYVNNSANIAIKPTAQSVTTTVGQIAATALGGRRNIMVKNLGSKEIYVGGDNTVTTANGFPVTAGGTIAIDLGQDAQIWAIAPSGSQAIRILEAA